MTGAYKVCGGVIRDSSGQIVVHLVSGFSPLAPLNAVLDGVNAWQLHNIAKDTSAILSLAKATTILSGLTLGVSAASFVFLLAKLKKIDERVAEIAKDVKKIRDFLESKEKAALTTALKTLTGLESDLDSHTRRLLLVNARQKLGEINQSYRNLLTNVSLLEEVLPIEEYYSVTALGHAMCSAELGMLKSSVSDLEEAYDTWLNASRRISQDLIIQKDPERFLFAHYAKHAKTDEIIDWLDFANCTNKGIAWIDDLRNQVSALRLPQLTPKRTAIELEVEVIRKLCARDRVYAGYSAQYQYMKSIKRRPSEVQAYFSSLNPDDRVDDFHLLVADFVKK